MRAYSLDLRRRVVAFVEASQSCHAAAAHFDVAGVLRGEGGLPRSGPTGSYAPKPEGGWRYSKLDPQRCFLERRMAGEARYHDGGTRLRTGDDGEYE